MKSRLALLVIFLGLAAWLSVLGVQGHDWAKFWAGAATALAFSKLIRFWRAKKKYDKHRAEA